MKAGMASYGADYLGLMLVTGMRRTACAQIRREHVDVRERTIFVPAPKGGEGVVRLRCPFRMRDGQLCRGGSMASNSPWLFPSPQDPEKPISDVRADGVFSDWKDAAGKAVEISVQAWVACDVH